MNISQILKSTQEQATASWIDHLNQLRLNELLSRLTSQDINLEKALNELQKIKTFVAAPEHILGSPKTKHGEIAEFAQVYISNARKLINGLKAEYTFEGVGRTAPEDYLRNGIPIQSKFNTGNIGNTTFNAIKKHLEKYPDFIKNGGKYDIPKDQFKNITELLEKPASQLNRSEYSFVQTIREWEKSNGISFTNVVNGSVVDYADVQQANIQQTVHSEADCIKNTDKQIRENAYLQSKPTLKEGMNATSVSAAIEGGMSFYLNVTKKLKSGKKLHDFTAKDWKDVCLGTAIGTGKGAIRGASVYGLTNFTATPAAVASALVTAAFGIISQAQLLHNETISTEDFIINSEVVCLDVAASAVSSLLGQVIIPIPVLGAIIGNAVGMFMYGLAKDFLSKHEQSIIADFNSSLEQLNQKLDKQYQQLILSLKEEFAKFSSVVTLAFDEDINKAFLASIDLANYIGVAKDKILKDERDIDNFFLI